MEMSERAVVGSGNLTTEFHSPGRSLVFNLLSYSLEQGEKFGGKFVRLGENFFPFTYLSAIMKMRTILPS